MALVPSAWSADAVPADWCGELVAACDASRQVPRPLPVQGDVFQAMLDDGLTDALDVAVAERLGNALTIGHRGVLAARRGAVADAADSLARCARLLEVFPAGNLGAVVGQAIFQAQQAYLDFVQGRDDDAIAALHRAFVLDRRAIEAGLRVMGMHQVQVLTNLMRLHLDRGRSAEAMDLAAFLLLCLESGDAGRRDLLAAQWAEDWTVDWTADQVAPRSLISAMHAQVASTLILALADAERPGGVPGWLHRLQAALRTGPAGQALLWCGFQCHAAEAAPARALVAACGLLRRGPDPSEPFWLAALLGVRSLLGEAAAAADLA